jgi:hypothetical protein
MVRASKRREDWVPEHPPSLKERALPSKYKRTLELVDRPLVSVRSSVNTSPLA